MQPCIQNDNKTRKLLAFLEDNENEFRVGDRSMLYKYRDMIKRCKFLLQVEEPQKQAEIIPFLQLQLRNNTL